MESYLIIDIGTGNVRVALVNVQGEITWVGRENVIYHKDANYEEGLFFDPEYLWSQILRLISNALNENKNLKIIGATASSQREGIVLLDENDGSIIGFPNHDHRGRFLEDKIEDKDAVYELTGRCPTSLFSAFKLIAFKEKYPEEWDKVDCFLSISDWAQYQLCGIRGYEHAQASETLLYDVEKKTWSKKLFELFDLDEKIVPRLLFSGTRLGHLKPELLNTWNLTEPFPVFVGGADTQLAVKSTLPKIQDIVVVSGTTTPIVKITKSYVLDDKQRSWTNSHLNKEEYILETNCGVTGLNFQRFKEIFYPKESYETIDQELDELEEISCFANLGSLIADDKRIVTRGGYLFEVPIMTELSRGDFAFATLWDVACSIRKNFECLIDIEDNSKDYVWGCGGGFRSKYLRKFVAGLLNRKLLIRPGYQQASVSGAAVICQESLGLKQENRPEEIIVVHPESIEKYNKMYSQWKETREVFV